jgi:hypothetical protein
MPLSNVNMPCLLLSWQGFIVLFHCRALSPTQNALDSSFVPPHTVGEIIYMIIVTQEKDTLMGSFPVLVKCIVYCMVQEADKGHGSMGQLGTLRPVCPA